MHDVLSRLEDDGKLLPQTDLTGMSSLVSVSEGERSVPPWLEDRLDEFLKAERYYVHRLGRLEVLREGLEANSTIGGDDLSAIFGCFGPLLEFHQQVLARLEHVRVTAASLDAWVKALDFEEEAFSIHETYALNIRRAFTVASERLSKGIIDAAIHPKVTPILNRRSLLLSALAEPIVHLRVYESILRVCQS